MPELEPAIPAKVQQHMPPACYRTELGEPMTNDDIDKAIQAIEERATMRFDDMQDVLTLLRELRDLRERVRVIRESWAIICPDGKIAGDSTRRLWLDSFTSNEAAQREIDAFPRRLEQMNNLGPDERLRVARIRVVELPAPPEAK